MTGRAGERLLTRMNSLMSLEKPAPRKGLFAVRTLVSLCGVRGFRLLRFDGVTLLSNVCLEGQQLVQEDAHMGYSKRGS